LIFTGFLNIYLPHGHIRHHYQPTQAGRGDQGANRALEQRAARYLRGAGRFTICAEEKEGYERICEKEDRSGSKGEMVELEASQTSAPFIQTRRHGQKEVRKPGDAGEACRQIEGVLGGEESWEEVIRGAFGFL
jgi:hypothetical protein